MEPTKHSRRRPKGADMALGLAAAMTAAAMTAAAPAQAPDVAEPAPPPGFRALFNGRDLEGWWGMPTQHPRFWRSLEGPKLERLRDASMKEILPFWTVHRGELLNDGNGDYLTTAEFFDDFELRASVKLAPGTDTGIHLRGIPQVQLFAPDSGRRDAALGSGGLWNNPPGAPGRVPLVKADRPVGEWNDVRIVMVGERVSVWLNDERVVNHARMINYFDRDEPMPRRGPIQLQAEGGDTSWRDIFIRELTPGVANEILASHGRDGFERILAGDDLSGWRGATDDYELQYGILSCRPGRGGAIYTEREYGDFAVRLQIRLPPGGNNGLAIRYPGEGDPAYTGICELQVLDDADPRYATLDPRQYHGSAYAQAAAARGYLREPGQWNFQEVSVVGSRITVELNGTRILDTDLAAVTDLMYPVERFPGRDRRRGHFGFAGHNDPVQFRDVRIKPLDERPEAGPDADDRATP